MGYFNMPLYDYENMGGNASQLEDRMDLMEFSSPRAIRELAKIVFKLGLIGL